MGVKAREAQADALFDEILEIADDSRNDTVHGENGDTPNHEWIARSKLRIDTRKWMAAKLRPKVYGDKIDVTSEVHRSGSFDVKLSALTDDELREAVAKQMLALGMRVVTDNVIDVVANEVNAEEVLDLAEVNRSLGDIDMKPTVTRTRAREVR